MELLGLHLARPWYVRLRLLMWWNYPNTNSTRFVSVEFMKMQGTNNPPTPYVAVEYEVPTRATPQVEDGQRQLKET